MKKLAIIGFLSVSALGTLFHFMYEWLPIFIFPSNESIFEHMKLVLFPFLLFIAAVLPFYKEDKGVLFSSCVTAIFISMAAIVISYYVYSGFLGFNVDAVNIILFYAGILAGFYFIYKKKTLISVSNSVIFLLIALILVVVFSFYPPDLGFFRV
ncbi:MAG: hypothetical protein K2K15_02800 [Anaeroplasmataceae bacterium]|nr:hypothetical protein [Anaeroplasmataceae bacterium]